MKGITLENIVKICDGKLVCDRPDIHDKEASGVVIDSRLVEAGFVFIATKGERVDGHSFIPQVFEKGALFVIGEEAPAENYGPVIVVENSFKALAKIAEYYRSMLNCKMVGVTGSVGKTSTKEFIAATLSAKYSVLKTQGNFNNEIGVPLTVLRIRDEHQVAVIEMGINHFGEMSRLTRIVKPDVVVMTNIGECHLEYLNDRDGVLKAKSEIFEGLADDGFVIVNGDDDKLITINKVKGKRPIRFGYDKCHDWYAIDMEDKGLRGRDVLIVNGETSFNIHVPLPGKHMVNNALAAFAVGNLFDMNYEEIARGIDQVKAVSGRSNIIALPNRIIIDDCYNANPVSTKAAIDLLCLADKRKVAILGDMFELGREEKELHSQVGEYAAKKKIDVIICIGQLSKYMFNGANGNNISSKIYRFDTKEEAIVKIYNIIKDGDSILVKASHGMHFEEIVEELKK